MNEATALPASPIYIGGLDRSGKTTMRGFLGSHSNIAIPAVGSNMWTYFYGQFGDLADAGNLERCLDAMFRYKHVTFLEPDRSRIEREFADGQATYARLFQLFLVHFAERQGKPRWGAQTGLIERYADELVRAFPTVRIVHMLRDPRDRYQASIARWPRGRGRAGGATARWRYSTGLAERHVARYPDNYLIVRFEDLVGDTDTVLRAVCRFVGEDFEPAMLSMPDAPELREKLGWNDGEGEHRLSADFVGTYRGSVPVDELAFIQLHAGSMMLRHGYAPAELDRRRSDRVRFALWRWPDQASRMIGWLGMEQAQQRFPRVVGRTPGSRMVVEPSRIDQGSVGSE